VPRNPLNFAGTVVCAMSLPDCVNMQSKTIKVLMRSLSFQNQPDVMASSRNIQRDPAGGGRSRQRREFPTLDLYDRIMLKVSVIQSCIGKPYVFPCTNSYILNLSLALIAFNFDFVNDTFLFVLSRPTAETIFAAFVREFSSRQKRSSVYDSRNGYDRVLDGQFCPCINYAPFAFA
jgi:hypothetical protein